MVPTPSSMSFRRASSLPRSAGSSGIRRSAASLKWDVDRIERFLRLLHGRVEIVEPDSAAVDTPRDPDDAPILGALVAGAADFLVTGDRDLLALRDRYPIETPAEFVRRI